MNFHLKRRYQDRLPDNEKIGRLVKGALGTQETLVLQKRHWCHFDWLAERGEDMSLWTQEADICCHSDQAFTNWDGAVSMLLENDERKRFLLGMDCPLFINSGGYRVGEATSVSEIKIVKRLPTDNIMIERKYQSAIGVEVPIQMPGKYWRHLDWICEQGGDDLGQEWVSHAEFDQSDPTKTLSDKLKFYLGKHEKDFYLDYMGNCDLELPLYISPIGYWEKLGQSIIERVCLDSENKEISVRMFRRYWHHLEWLDVIGEDSQKFFNEIHAAFLLRQPEDSFSSTLMSALLKDFKARLARNSSFSKNEFGQTLH